MRLRALPPPAPPAVSSSRPRLGGRLAAALVLVTFLPLSPARAQAPAQPPSATAKEPPAGALMLSGRVTDAAGMPLAQVSVAISELRRGALTDEHGRYAIPEIPAGLYRVSFQRLGYAPLVQRFMLGAGATALDVTLRESAIELPATQVTASAGATTPLTSPQPVSVLSGEALRQAQSANLGSTLELLPGLRSWSTGSGIGKPAIRGMRSDRVVIASQDLRLDHQQWGDEHGPQVETAEIDRVEVIRGPGSVLYGSDALGGVVHVIPRLLPVAFGRAPFIGGQAHGAYASGDRGREGGFALEGAAEGFGARASYTDRRGDDLRTPEGRLFNSGHAARTGSGSVGLRGTRGSLDLSYTRRLEEVRIHEDPAEDPAATPRQEIEDDHGRLAAIVPLSPRSRLEVSLGAGRNRRSEYESSDDPNVALGLTTRTWGGVVQFHHPPAGRFEGMLGVSFQRRGFDKFGEESLIPASESGEAALFAFEEAEVGRWRVALGARYDHRSLDVEDDLDLGVAAQRRQWSALSGSAGVVYRLSEPVACVASLGRGFRAPSSYDLFANGVHEGTVSYEVGDPGLGVETSLNADVGLRIQSPRLTAELGAFHNRIDDYIRTRPTGTFDSASGFEIFRTVQGDARLFGFEAALEVHAGRHLHVSLSSDYVRGDDLDTGTPLPWIPPMRALYGVRYEAGPLGGIREAHLGLRGESLARQNRLDPLDTTVPGYTLLHADAGCELAVAGRTVALDLGVRNLADLAHRDFMSRLKTYALSPGRSLTMRVTSHF